MAYLRTAAASHCESLVLHVLQTFLRARRLRSVRSASPPRIPAPACATNATSARAWLRVREVPCLWVERKWALRAASTLLEHWPDCTTTRAPPAHPPTRRLCRPARGPPRGGAGRAAQLAVQAGAAALVAEREEGVPPAAQVSQSLVTRLGVAFFSVGLRVGGGGWGVGGGVGWGGVRAGSCRAGGRLRSGCQQHYDAWNVS